MMALCEDLPSIQSHRAGFSLDSFSDKFFTTLNDKAYDAEISLIGNLERFNDEGLEMVQMVYSFRSLSKAIPEIIISASNNSAVAEDEKNTKDIEIKQTVIELLKPGISKIKDFMIYVSAAINAIDEAVSRIATIQSIEGSGGNSSYLGLYSSMIKLLDTLFKLDNLKDMRGSMKIDFSRYKRAIGSHTTRSMSGVQEDMMKIQLFLSSQDPYKSKNYILLTLKDRLKTIRGHDRILFDIINSLVESLEYCQYVTPDEKFGFIRLIPHLMVLLDGDVTDPKSFNIFNTKKAAISTLQKLMKRYTVVPLHADMSITLLYILERCPHFNFFTVGETWGSYTNTGFHEKKGKTEKGIEPDYDLSFDWQATKTDYSQFVVLFTAYLNQLSKTNYYSLIDNGSLNAMTSDEFSILEAARIAMNLSLKGFALLSQWKSQLQLTLAWKYTHPNCSSTSNVSAVPNCETTLSKEGEKREQQGLEYEQVIQRNFSKDELRIVVGMISYIKSLSSILSDAEATIGPLLRIYTHHRIQHVARSDLLPLLHRVDKRKKNSHLTPLLKIRDLVADYSQGTNRDDEDFKSYSRKQGSMHIKHQLRVVSVSNSQLYMFRSQIHALCDEKSVYRQKKGLLGKADLEREDIQALETFYKESFFYPYLLNFQETLMKLSDMGELWYREFYLELTKCVQFPIEMSLPWILIELVIGNQNSVENGPSIIDDVFYILDIYNDAAHHALHIFHRQHLFDEIEAEANLVLEQLIVSLSEDSYEYYKNITAKNMLERNYKSSLEEMRGEMFLSVGIQKFDSLIRQRNVIILGRSVNLSAPIIQHVVRRLCNDVDIAIRIFESDDVCCIIELKGLLDIIQQTHNAIADHLEIDDYNLIFNEVNESSSSTRGSTLKVGRIMNHIMNSINNDIIPNFSYNTHTKRFVRSPMPLEDNGEHGLNNKSRNYSASVKSAEINSAYGSLCSKVYEPYAKLSRGFFGKPHIEALISLVGCTASQPGIFVIVEKCFIILTEKLQDAHDYVGVLREGIPLFDSPPHSNHTEDCCKYYELKLTHLLEFEDLKPEIFQIFREIGNIILLMQDVSNSLTIIQPLNMLLGKLPSKFLSIISQRRKDIAHVSPQLSSSSQIQSDESLFKHALNHIESTIMEFDLFRSWNDISYTPGGPLGFYKIWSAVNFLTNASPFKNSDKERFGDGLTVAGCVLLHVLDEKKYFDITDFCSYILRVHAHDCQSAAIDRGGYMRVGIETECFVIAASESYNLQQICFDMLEKTWKKTES